MLTEVWYNEWVNSQNVRLYSLVITHVNTYVGKVSSVTRASGNTPRSITLSQFNLHNVPAWATL